MEADDICGIAHMEYYHTGLAVTADQALRFCLADAAGPVPGETLESDGLQSHRGADRNCDCRVHSLREVNELRLVFVLIEGLC